LTCRGDRSAISAGLTHASEFRIQEEKLTDSAREAAQLSDQRFNAGATDYLEVLTNATNFFRMSSRWRRVSSMNSGFGSALPGSRRLAATSQNACSGNESVVRIV
jgi:hypothetical protein